MDGENMIRCAKCGYVGSYYGPKCPSCKQIFTLTPDEIEEKILEIEKAEEMKEYELAAEGHHILADLGRTESQKKYAALLEKGDIVARDLDAAMSYYYMAAEKNDAKAAFKYSRLAVSISENLPVPFSSSPPFFFGLTLSLPHNRGSIWYIIGFCIASIF